MKAQRDRVRRGAGDDGCTARALLRVDAFRNEREPLRGKLARAATHLSLPGVLNVSRLGSLLEVTAIVPAARETR